MSLTIDVVWKVIVLSCILHHCCCANHSGLLTASPVLDWDKYPFALSLTQINTYLKNIAVLSPFCTLTSIGKTAEHRDIYMLSIKDKFDKPIIMIEGGVHGHKKMGIFSILYFIESIAKNFTRQSSFIQQYNWYIIPVLNPDGYEYSINHNSNWGKNRRVFHEEQCVGVDIDSNFPYKWSKGKASTVVCNPYYCGPTPFSELESQALRKVVDEHLIEAYLSIQCAESKNKVMSAGVEDVQVKFTRAIVGAMRRVDSARFVSDTVIGEGTAMSWLYHEEHIAHSYVIQARDQHKTQYEMILALKEVSAGIMKFAQMYSICLKLQH